jgi:hypothetical protein
MPELKDGEILLKVLACGVCHSDHHVLNGDMGPPYALSALSNSSTSERTKLTDLTDKSNASDTNMSAMWSPSRHP